MKSVEERERNLLNATDTLAQFYDEVDSFMDILFREMNKMGYTAKAERLRPGTFTIRNLPRRLLGTGTVLYVKDIGEQDEGLEEAAEEANVEELDVGKAVKAEIQIAEGLKIPFASIWLFDHKSVPSLTTLSSPLLLTGAIGDMQFVEKKTGEVATLTSPTLSLSNLVQLRIDPGDKPGRSIRLNCWRPRSMRKYRLQAKLVEFETQKLLEIDSQDKIRGIAEKVAGFCGA